jgi:hypothetical protein
VSARPVAAAAFLFAACDAGGAADPAPDAGATPAAFADAGNGNVGERDAAPEAPPPADREVVGNNAAIFRRPISFGSALPSQLRRELEVLGPSTAETKIGRAFITRGGYRATVAIEVENTGRDTRCFISLDPLEFLDAEGGAVDAGYGTAYVQGRVGGDYVQTDTCLAPGQRGLFGEAIYSEAEAARIVAVRFEVDDGQPTTTQPLASVRPRQLWLGRRDGLRIEVRNEGRGVAEIPFAFWWLFDDDGLPLVYGFMDPCVGADNAPAFCAATRYEGGAGAAAFFLDFEDVTYAARAGDAATADPDLARYRALRDARYRDELAARARAEAR